MTGERVIEALRFHDAQIVAWTAEPCTPLRCQEPSGLRDRLGHLRWMVNETESFIHKGQTDKAMRWLGFIQGALWVLGISSIEEAKRANMPPDEVFKP